MRALLFDEAAETEMRSLYAYLGVRPTTIEAAILMRRKPPEAPCSDNVTDQRQEAKRLQGEVLLFI